MCIDYEKLDDAGSWKTVVNIIYSDDDSEGEYYDISGLHVSEPSRG